MPNKQTELLKQFLSEKGLTAYFLHNLKIGRGDGIKTIEEYIVHLNAHGHPLRQAFFFAFWWSCDYMEGRGYNFWERHSRDWRNFLKDRLK